MSKPLVNENDYFIESKKALQIAREREREEHSKLKTKDLLQLVKKHLEIAGTQEEYEQLVELEKELVMKIKFNQYHVPAVPPEYTEKIKRNAEIERVEASKKLGELKAQLSSKIEYLEKEVIPLVKGIKKLEDQRYIPDQIDIILDSDIGETAPISMSGRLGLFSTSNSLTQSGKALAETKSLIAHLKSIQGNTANVTITTNKKKKGDRK